LLFFHLLGRWSQDLVHVDEGGRGQRDGRQAGRLRGPAAAQGGAEVQVQKGALPFCALHFSYFKRDACQKCFASLNLLLFNEMINSFVSYV